MTDRPATFFASPSQWREWLAARHESERELWVGFAKRHTGMPSLTWPESVDEALCFGWIDGLRQRVDDDRYRIRFTPRKPDGIWSAVNSRRIGELIDSGLVMPAGLAAWERRKDGRQAIYTYENEAMALPPHYLALLRTNPAASAYWDLRPPSYRKGATHWVMSAKREQTRDKRMSELVADSAAGRFIKPFLWAKGADKGTDDKATDDKGTDDRGTDDRGTDDRGTDEGGRSAQ